MYPISEQRGWKSRTHSSQAKGRREIWRRGRSEFPKPERLAKVIEAEAAGMMRKRPGKYAMACV
jgi:hypothetical protein